MAGRGDSGNEHAETIWAAPNVDGTMLVERRSGGSGRVLKFAAIQVIARLLIIEICRFLK
jgi:hypothetical protein